MKVDLTGYAKYEEKSDSKFPEKPFPQQLLKSDGVFAAVCTNVEVGEWPDHNQWVKFAVQITEGANEGKKISSRRISITGKREVGTDGDVKDNAENNYPILLSFGVPQTEAHKMGAINLADLYGQLKGKKCFVTAVASTFETNGETHASSSIARFVSGDYYRSAKEKGTHVRPYRNDDVAELLAK